MSVRETLFSAGEKGNVEEVQSVLKKNQPRDKVLIDIFEDAIWISDKVVGTFLKGFPLRVLAKVVKIPPKSASIEEVKYRLEFKIGSCCSLSS